MKFDYQKMFPYPVLRPFTDDYISSEFQATVEMIASEGSSEIGIRAQFVTSCNEILDRIDKEQAIYSLVISCRDTYIRTVVRSDSSMLYASFPGGTFKGEVEVQPFVTVEQDFGDYLCKDINPEFGTGPFAYRRGQILAMDETHIFYIDRDMFRPITSVFELVKDDSHTGASWRVRLDQDHVQIVLSPIMKELLDDARNTTPNKAILINSVYFGAVLHALQALKDSSEYDDWKWAGVVKQQCHNKGVDIQAHDAYETAQTLMHDPLALLQRYVFEGASE